MHLHVGLKLKQIIVRLLKKTNLHADTMTSLEHPEAIRHFQSLCDACQELISSRQVSPSELMLYADGYLHALRNCRKLDQKDQKKLENLIERWILDPSSFVGPDGDINRLYFKKEIF